MKGLCERRNIPNESSNTNIENAQADEIEEPLPVTVLADSTHGLVGLLPHKHPQHDRRGEGQAIPAKCERTFERQRVTDDARRKLPASLTFRLPDLPSEDVLCMVISKVDFRSTANGNTLGLAII